VSYVPCPAGFWQRYVAYFVDVLLLSIVNQVLVTAGLAVAFTAGGGFDLEAWTQRAIANPPVDLDGALALPAPLGWLTAASLVAYVVVAAAYFIGLEASSKQASFGKQLVGIRVTDRDGNPPGFGRAAGRFFAATLSWLTLNLGHALAAWTKERRALHDYLAGTRVEHVDRTRTAMPGWGWLIIGVSVLLFVVLPALLIAGLLALAMQANALG
jgi:uncharacterized RDD family membrane protein YckC